MSWGLKNGKKWDSKSLVVQGYSFVEVTHNDKCMYDIENSYSIYLLDLAKM